MINTKERWNTKKNGRHNCHTYHKHGYASHASYRQPTGAPPQRVATMMDRDVTRDGYDDDERVQAQRSSHASEGESVRMR